MTCDRDSTSEDISQQLAIVAHAGAVARSFHAKFPLNDNGKLAVADLEGFRRSLHHLERAILLLEHTIREIA